MPRMLLIIPNDSDLGKSYWKPIILNIAANTIPIASELVTYGKK
jgi:hypothetical protein